MGDEGLEPATNRLRVYCSTIELVTHVNKHDSKIVGDLPRLSLCGGQIDDKGGLTGITLDTDGST